MRLRVIGFPRSQEQLHSLLWLSVHPTSSWFEEVDTYEIAQVVNARDQADDKNNKDYAKKEDVDVWALEDDNA